MAFGWRSFYSPIHDTEPGRDSDETLLEKKPEDGALQCSCHESNRGRLRWAPAARVTVPAAVLSTILLLFVAVVYLLNKSPAVKECVEKLYAYTPAMEAIEYYDSDFENVFAQKSIYRGPPTVERETAWLELWQFQGILVPPHGLPLLNRSEEIMDRYVKVSPEKGDGYIALLETFHQLHCLDLIRQYTWWLMGKYPEDRIPPDLTTGDKGNRMHVDHCIETLRLSLMCQADTTPLLVLKDPDGKLGKKADFNTHHRCRNFEKIQEWAKANEIEGVKEGDHLHDHVHSD